MAFSLNRAQVIGNITRDPELRQTPGGVAVVSFSVATNFTWTDQNGQQQERAEFHNIVAWRKLAEICGQWLKKGMKVYVEGRIQTRDWEGDDGVKRYRTEIVADNMIMLDKKREGSGSESNYSSNEAGMKEQNDFSESAPVKAAQNSVPDMSGGEVALDDLPF